MNQLALLAVFCVVGCGGAAAARPTPVVVDVAAPAPPAVAVGSVSTDSRARAEERPVPARVAKSAPAPQDGDVVLEPGLEGKLSSGLVVGLIVEVEVQDGAGALVRIPAGTCTVTFDLWDEVFKTRAPAGAPPVRTKASANVGGVVRQCTDAQAYSAAVATAPPGTASRLLVRAK